MTTEILKSGKELSELIKTTSEALEEIKKFKPESGDSQLIHDDKMYWLSISKHKDGSGIRADLSRYFGNQRLIEVIKTELQLQLEEFRAEFENL